MTDTTNTPKEPTKAEQERLQKLADAFAKDGTMEEGYEYRYVTSGGETKPIVTKIERSA
jgi:hypothetical protein